MKRIVLFFLLALVAFAGSFALARFYIFAPKLLVALPLTPAPFVLKNRPFVIIIVGFNNGATVEKTLTSVFSQNYDNYRVIYIDDASDNGSFDFARDCIYDSDLFLTQVTFVQNETRLGPLANIFRAIQTCQDEEIVLILQGEGRLAHEWVLQRLNAYYADPDLWLGVGQNIDFPTYQRSPSQILQEGEYRSQLSMSPHLKTFYASLFKRIREPDLLYLGTFFPASMELSYMIPMLEMGKGHFQFIPEVLCIGNQNVPENLELQLRCEALIRSLDSYAPLTTLQVCSCGD